MAWDLQYLEVRKKDLVSTFGFPLSIMSHNFYVSQTLRLLVSLGSQVFLPLRSQFLFWLLNVFMVTHIFNPRYASPPYRQFPS